MWQCFHCLYLGTLPRVKKLKNLVQSATTAQKSSTPDCGKSAKVLTGGKIHRVIRVFAGYECSRRKVTRYSENVLEGRRERIEHAARSVRICATSRYKPAAILQLSAIHTAKLNFQKARARRTRANCVNARSCFSVQSVAHVL